MNSEAATDYHCHNVITISSQAFWQAMSNADLEPTIITDADATILWLNDFNNKFDSTVLIGRSLLQLANVANRMIFRRHLGLCVEGKRQCVFKFSRVEQGNERNFTVCLSEHMPINGAATYLWRLQSFCPNNDIEIDHCLDQDCYLAVANRMQENLVTEFMSAIADELNQPLMSIVVYIGGCLEKLKQGQYCNQMPIVLERIMEQAELIGQRIHQLKHIVKHYDDNSDHFSLNDVIRNTLTLLKQSFVEAKIVVELDLAKALPEVLFDKVQLQQILLYVLMNAQEELQACDTENRIIHIQSLQQVTGEIHVIIWDNGRGITPECLEQIFDPFYTTKQQSLGMGLSMTRSVMESHGGKIMVSSDETTGTVLTLILPIANGT